MVLLEIEYSFSRPPKWRVGFVEPHSLFPSFATILSTQIKLPNVAGSNGLKIFIHNQESLSKVIRRMPTISLLGCELERLQISA